jgi:hypothetical protein
MEQLRLTGSLLGRNASPRSTAFNVAFLLLALSGRLQVAMRYIPADSKVEGFPHSTKHIGDVRTNGAYDLGASVSRAFTLGGRPTLRLEVSSYNGTNSVQFGYTSASWKPSPTSANMSGFGQITSDTYTLREFQLASRFIF